MYEPAMEKPFVNNEFQQLCTRYPALYAAIRQFFISGNKIRRDEIEPDQYGILRLGMGWMQLFSAVSYLKMRGVELSFAGMVLRNDGYIKTGELWMDHEGDELLAMPGQDEVYYYSTLHQTVSLLSPGVDEFVQRVLVPFICGED
ncbi:hypothetical protein SAMN05444266_10354 [Chitinophaga jiangningensis]|uniref:Uncharacterized protein n=1 Tax=Chitinophaga jiangningensis TaxID=1419482 RepID=A0A1M6ZYH1_9BACT|nr:hypothetical protein [Chitinophaga jiangningensis]SHL35484.1 hypothetical protein SAMN05444266_10354 [Chitinophaga jiangningensis]